MASANAIGLLLGTKIHGVSLTATMEFVNLTNRSMINVKEKRIDIKLTMERGVGTTGEVLNVLQTQVIGLLKAKVLVSLYISPM